MELLLFGLITLVSFGNFVDFLIGSRGNSKLKSGLAGAWFHINEGGLRRMVPDAARALGRFIDAVLAPPGLTPRYFLRTLRASAFINLITFVVVMTSIGIGSALINDVPADEMTATIMYLAKSLTGYLVVVYLSDLLAWALARRTLACLEAGHWRLALAWAVMMLGGCVAALLISNMTINAFAYQLVHEIGIVEALGDVVRSALEHPLDMLWPFDGMFGAFFLPSLSVFLPLSVFLLTLVTGMLLSALDPLIRRPLSLLLERAEASTKGLFTLVSITVAALVSILSAAMRAF